MVKERLLTPDAVAAFIASFTEEVNRRRDELLGQRRTVEARLAQTERKLQGLYDAIAEGLRTPGLLGQLQELEAERDRLVASVAEAEPTPVRLHPNLPELYRKEVARLRDALADPLIREGAVEQLRRLMTKVTVRPGENCVDLVVEGAVPLHQERRVPKKHLRALFMYRSGRFRRYLHRPGGELSHSLQQGRPNRRRPSLRARLNIL